ncbi:HlyC/CorC family transporter [Desulfovibrionales bacterium]
MEDDSENIFWPLFNRIFGSRDDDSIEKAIIEAKDDGELKPDEVAMLLNVLRLGRKQVSEISIPRMDIVCADVDDLLLDVAQLIFTHGHSRIPIYCDSRDNIVGIVHAKDLLKALFGPILKDHRIKDIMRTPFFIPNTKNIKDLLQEFRSRKVHLAITRDEYGGNSGLVTFEDVLEEIVGEIEDEYDTPRPEDIQTLENHDILVNGRTSLEEIKIKTSIHLHSEQVETIGGYLCELAGRVPSKGERFALGVYRFHIEDADAKQVRSIRIQTQYKDE